MRRLFLFALSILFARTCVAEVTIRWVTSANASEEAIEVTDLDRSALEALRSASSARLSNHLKVYVGEPEDSSSVPAVLGEYLVGDDRLIFRPRFPLVPGQRYRVEFTSPVNSTQPRRSTIEIPKKEGTASPAPLVAIFPTTSALPRNLLKFYLHFSAPMQQGHVYRFIELAIADGKKVELPFLEIAEELWDKSGTRLTLLLDPGRVKRGLASRDEEGAIFEIGGKYRLVIRPEWQDAHGIPIGIVPPKEFRIIEEDFEQPKPMDWKIVAPASKKTAEKGEFGGQPSRLLSKSLQICFPEPLDHALLSRCITVRSQRGQRLEGDIQTVDEERCWQFCPKDNWESGNYSVHIDPILEDLAGNSVSRPFEVDLRKQISPVPLTLTLPFTVP